MAVMSSSDTSILSRLLVTRSGDLAYDAGGVIFTADATDIYEAHTDELYAGAHPYAAVSLSYIDEDAMDLRNGCETATDEDITTDAFDADATAEQAVADWMAWCDDVVAILGDHPDDPADLSDILDAMRAAWRLDADASDRIAEVNAAA